jgi:hypothetical protein
VVPDDGIFRERIETHITSISIMKSRPRDHIIE